MTEAEWLASSDPMPMLEFLRGQVSDRKLRLSLQCDLLRCVIGNPFRPVTADSRLLTSTGVSLARAMYVDRAFDRLPILADTQEEAGCGDVHLLAHCRGDAPHVRGYLGDGPSAGEGVEPVSPAVAQGVAP